MKERPIIFSAPMVRAILGNRKHQTRRLVKPKQLALLQSVADLPSEGLHQAFVEGKFTVSDSRSQKGGGVALRSPYGQPGDLLWVKETWRYQQEPVENNHRGNDCGNGRRRVVYRSDDYPPGVSDGKNPGEDAVSKSAVPWRSSLFMPRSASRILLKVTEVRIERLQSISVADAIAEGMSFQDDSPEFSPEAPEAADAVHTAKQPLYGPIARYRALFELLNGPGSWEANPLVWVVNFLPVQAGITDQGRAIAP
jgi:hypothetical protein